MALDDVRLCIKGAQLILHGVRFDANGQIADHIDIVLPWGFQRALSNFDGIDYRSLDGETS